MDRTARELDRAQLPVIDLSLSSEELQEPLASACEDFGFFYVNNHGVPLGLVDALFEQSRRFHSQAVEDKERLRINRFHRGYIGLSSYRLDRGLLPNLSESLVVMHELGEGDPRTGKPLQGPNEWPELPGFRETALLYVGELENVGRRLLKALARVLHRPEAFFLPMFEKPTTFLRLLHYPPQGSDARPNQFGSAPHTDYGAITILAQDEASGLHVRQRRGKREWLSALPIPGTFVVNLGDLMARWTNDRFVSTPHRVINVSGSDRYSIPFFFDPDMDTIVETVTGEEDRPAKAKYPPLRYGDYLLQRLDAHYAYRGASAAPVD